MDDKFYIREISASNTETAIKDTGFDSAYINIAAKKYRFKLIKICNLSCPQATIIKQLALSLGADAAVHREVITCKVEKSDLVIGATVAQLENIIQKLKKQPFKLPTLAEKLEKQLKPQKHNWEDKTYIMSILNVTPDSFSDGGKYLSPETAATQAVKMIEEGADIIDIGGESTRPHADEIDAEEELSRVIPVIKKIRELNDKVLLSIDTRRSEVARRAVEAGVNIINDVSGLSYDEKMPEIASKAGVPIVVMHSVGPSETVYCYEENIVDAVYKDLFNKTQYAISAGIKPENIIIDPGIGFGKSVEQNIELIKRLSEFKSMGYPVLIGFSRKSFIQKILNLESQETEDANLALACYSSINGADIIRVHEVNKQFKALQMLQKLH